jgi:hypothetical protein
VETSACAAAKVTPGASLASAGKPRSPRAARASGDDMAIIDTHTSPASERPVNEAGATPTMVKTWALSGSGRPIASGARPKARSHNRSPITATSGASGASSAAVSTRPRRGSTPSI